MYLLKKLGNSSHRTLHSLDFADWITEGLFNMLRYSCISYKLVVRYWGLIRYTFIYLFIYFWQEHSLGGAVYFYEEIPNIKLSSCKIGNHW